MKENVFPTPPLFVNGSFFKKANIFTLFFADHHFSQSNFRFFQTIALYQQNYLAPLMVIFIFWFLMKIIFLWL